MIGFLQTLSPRRVSPRKPTWGRFGWAPEREGLDPFISVPLVAEQVLDALARAGGRHGWSSRTAVTEVIGAGHLPTAATRRRTKARFNEVYWRERSRSFAAAWTGELDRPNLVDASALRREWLLTRPDLRSAVLLQAEGVAKRFGTTPT